MITRTRHEITGWTLHGFRRKAQKIARQRAAADVDLTEDDVLDCWHCCLDPEDAARDYLIQQGFEPDA